MSRLSARLSSSLPYLAALTVLVCLACLFTTTAAARPAFVPHMDNSPPVYNFQTFLPNRVFVNGTYIYVGPQYITPNILWALIVGAFLLIILWVALSCLMGIQRPLKMSTVPLVLAKEY